jgi:tetratricopeptide (TPR) repeat protein
LDFDGNAQREMLIATSGERRLLPTDRMYLAAIRANLTRDFPRSLVIYRQILERIPIADKPSGYVDLGMAYERAGEPEQALKSYAQATLLDKNYAASYLHTAILDSRLNKVPEADNAFNKAETIFAAEMNQEGQAELDYERGYLANVNGESDKAKRYLNRSLEEAKQIQSVQLEIRTLTQLSSVSCASGDMQKAVDFAQQAIRLARDNRLDSWAAFGLARLANARLMEGSAHFQEADDSVTQALALARQSQQRRAEALANVVLASLRDAQHRPDEVIPPATSALAYYKKNGYFEPAADATLLLLRANQSRGQFQQTLQTANDFLSLAKQSGSQDLLMQAEQQLGATYQDAERYPESLPHLQRALELASNRTNRAYQAIACAGILVRLGRFAEAETLIAPFAQEQPFVADIGELRVSALLRQEQYEKALMLSNKMLEGNPDMMGNLKSEFELHRAIAEAHLHKPAQALADYQTIKAANSGYSESERAALALRGAEVQVFAGANQEAFENATVAEQYFVSTTQLDSQLRAALFAAIAAKAMHEASANNKFSAKAFDILSKLKQNWDPETLSVYLSRPDLRTLMRVLPKDVHAVASKN